ncbi:MAG: RNA 2',3'-cyclic phosphodiesterase [Pseudonocardiaceae bacterium]
MRLFVALTPPAEVVEELRAGTSALQEMTQREVAPQLRWTRPEQWHLTLAFLGEVDEPVVAELTTRLARAAKRHPPLSLSFGGGGRFGQRVLWTRVNGDRHGLGRLADSVRAAARRCGLPVEQRPYRPHLTLARADGGTDLQPLVEGLASGEGQPWVADRLYLIHSRLGAGPDRSALHEPAASWPLEGGSSQRASTRANSSGT